MKKSSAEGANNSKNQPKDAPSNDASKDPKGTKNNTPADTSKDPPKSAKKDSTDGKISPKSAKQDSTDPKISPKSAKQDGTDAKISPKSAKQDGTDAKTSDTSVKPAEAVDDIADSTEKEGKKTENLRLRTMQEAAERASDTGDDKDVPLTSLLQPMCARELLLSKECHQQLEANNSIKGKMAFVIIAVTIAVCLLCHGVAILVMAYRNSRSERMQSFSFDHVRTPCAVIRNINTELPSLVFSDLPYASFTYRFEESHMVASFQDCYWHYFLLADEAMTSFESGVFYWDYQAMLAKRTDRTAWRLQPQRPDSAELTGSSSSLSLSISTPKVTDRLPVIVLVTGNDFTYNKPMLPSPGVVSKLHCVVVTINYRLGLDGAAVFNRENYMGNLFAGDVVQALAWLNRTVANFGGNPGRITYLGDGSGATLGLWLMASPEAVYVNRFWLMDPSVEIPTLSEFGTMVEDIFLQEPSPMAASLNASQIDDCYRSVENRVPAGCLIDISAAEVLRITPQWMREVYKYLDEFPNKATRNTSERSLLHLPPTMLNGSLLLNLRAGKLKLANKPIVFHSSSARSFYSTVFPTGRRSDSRYRVQLALSESLERMFITRKGRDVGTKIVQHYVDLMKAEVNEDEIDYEQVRRMLLHDMRSLCPVQAFVYHLVVKKIVTRPVYNLLDLSAHQSVPVVVAKTDMHCNLPRFLVHDFGDTSNSACRLAFDVGEEGQRQLREYREAGIAMLSDFAYDESQPDHHPHHMVAAVGFSGSDGFEASANLLDHRGNLPGMDTRRSQLVKSVCHELYGSLRNDWPALLYAARYN